ncbi:MAG: hypothetical protein ACR2G1_02295, partial [Rubrobacteraceae bacterium]
ITVRSRSIFASASFSCSSSIRPTSPNIFSRRVLLVGKPYGADGEIAYVLAKKLHPLIYRVPTSLFFVVAARCVT